MWFGRDAYKQLYDYIKPYACSGDNAIKDTNTTAVVHSLMRNDIGSIEQLKAMTDDDIKNLTHVGALRADIIKRARAGVDPSVKGDYVKTQVIEYKLPFETPEDFVTWRDEVDDNDDFARGACDICPIAKLCDLFCSIETELGIEDRTVGCSKMYEIVLANVKKEDK